MTNENTAPNAQAFEDFARDLDLEVRWLGEGYSDCNTDYAWLAWNAALASKQVANTDTVRDEALEEAANAVASTITLGMTAGSAITKLCAVIRALKSSPPAPQPESKP